MDRGAWWATVHGVAKSRTRLRDFTFFLSFFLEQMEGFPLAGGCGASGKEPTCPCRPERPGCVVPGLGRFSGGGHQPTPVFSPG